VFVFGPLFCIVISSKRKTKTFFHLSNLSANSIKKKEEEKKDPRRQLRKPKPAKVELKKRKNNIWQLGELGVRGCALN